MALGPVRQMLAKLVGVKQVEERVDETDRRHETLRGEVRDMRQRLESLRRIVTGIRHGDSSEH